jgi:hypothetical protein
LPAIAAAKESVLSDDTAKLLLRLDQKVDPKHCALVVIDVQNDFAADGGFFDKVGADLKPIQAERVPALLRLITGAPALSLRSRLHSPHCQIRGEPVSTFIDHVPVP